MENCIGQWTNRTHDQIAHYQVLYTRVNKTCVKDPSLTFLSSDHHYGDMTLHLCTKFRINWKIDCPFITKIPFTQYDTNTNAHKVDLSHILIMVLIRHNIIIIICYTDMKIWWFSRWRLSAILNFKLWCFACRWIPNYLHYTTF